MTFPNKSYAVIGAFADDYFEHLAGAAASVDRAALAEPGDALITISSSGNSENVVRACQ